MSRSRNVQVFDVSPDHKLSTDQHALHKKGSIKLYGRDIQYKSILCPVNVQRIVLSVGGQPDCETR